MTDFHESYCMNSGLEAIDELINAQSHKTYHVL